MKKNTILFLSLLFLFACKSDDSQLDLTIENGDNFFKTEAFEVDSGWGYKILINDKVFIKQEIIPAVNGNFFFQTKEAAEIAGVFVMQKLAKNEGLPTVNFEELQNLGVLSDEVIEYQKIKFSTKTGIKPEDY